MLELVTTTPGWWNGRKTLTLLHGRLGNGWLQTSGQHDCEAAGRSGWEWVDVGIPGLRVRERSGGRNHFCTCICIMYYVFGQSAAFLLWCVVQHDELSHYTARERYWCPLALGDQTNFHTTGRLGSQQQQSRPLLELEPRLRHVAG